MRETQRIGAAQRWVVPVRPHTSVHACLHPMRCTADDPAGAETPPPAATKPAAAGGRPSPAAPVKSAAPPKPAAPAARPAAAKPAASAAAAAAAAPAAGGAAQGAGALDDAAINANPGLIRLKSAQIGAARGHGKRMPAAFLAPLQQPPGSYGRPAPRPPVWSALGGGRRRPGPRHPLPPPQPPSTGCAPTYRQVTRPRPRPSSRASRRSARSRPSRPRSARSRGCRPRSSDCLLT